MQVPAGWYPDQTSPGLDRYWDGKWWTSQTRESAMGGHTPPPPPPVPQMQGQSQGVQPPQSVEKSFLSMTPEEFEVAIEDLASRKRTYQALRQIQADEVETARRAREILDGHKMKAGRGVMRTQIQGLVAWQKQRAHPSMEALGGAMQMDFDEFVERIGGPIVMAVPMGEALDGYMRPIRLIIDDLNAEVMPLLTGVGEIEDQYLSG